MSDQQSISAESAPAAAAISEDRRLVALEATWEIEALNDAIRELTQGLGTTNMGAEELSPIRLKIRGMTSRIEDLICVAMSVLDDDGDTQSLTRRVHGRREPAEAPRA